MSEKSTILAHNIKTLRSSKKWSQEELAKKLNVSRSNIAAYESKNVEPRLRSILELASIFDVSVRALIESRITDVDRVKSFNASKFANPLDETRLVIKPQDVSEFIAKSIKIRKVVDGFKALFSFRKSIVDPSDKEFPRQEREIENLMEVMEALMAHNENVIKALKSAEGSPSVTPITYNDGDRPAVTH